MISFTKKEEERSFSIQGKAISGIKKAKELAWKMKLNPHGTIKEGIKEGTAWVAENPDVALMNTAGSAAQYALLNKVNPALAMASLSPGVPGIGTAYLAGKAKLGSPKFMKKLGDKIRNSKSYDEAISTVLGKQPEIPISHRKGTLSERAKYHIKSGVADLSNLVQSAGKTVVRTIAASDTEQKNFTIQEGHYTGPKDMEKVPGTIEVLGKATVGGAGIGALGGGILKEVGGIEETGILDGLKKGGKIGFFAGIAMKALLNYLHKPMSKVKYQEVDRHLRKEFGMYRVAGVTIGDSREKRKTYDEKFGTNDRNVTEYPINISVCSNKVTLYTLNLTDVDLEKLNGVLDYYCKKYSGMEYSSQVINSRNNTYSVNIIFTNYDIISSFIMEVSESLGCRINLLNNDILAETRIGKEEIHDKEEERVYSNIPSLSKYDIAQIFTKSGAKSITALALNGPRVGFAFLILETLEETLRRLGINKIVRLIGGSRKDYNIDFLKSEIKRLGFLEGPHYTIGENKSDLNISMVCGKVIITTTTGTKPDLVLPKILEKFDYKKTEINGKANLWTFLIDSKGSFDIFLKSLIGTLKPNIYANV